MNNYPQTAKCVAANTASQGLQEHLSSLKLISTYTNTIYTINKTIYANDLIKKNIPIKEL